MVAEPKPPSLVTLPTPPVKKPEPSPATLKSVYRRGERLVQPIIPPAVLPLGPIPGFDGGGEIYSGFTNMPDGAPDGWGRFFDGIPTQGGQSLKSEAEQQWDAYWAARDAERENLNNSDALDTLRQGQALPLYRPSVDYTPFGMDVGPLDVSPRAPWVDPYQGLPGARPGTIQFAEGGDIYSDPYADDEQGFWSTYTPPLPPPVVEPIAPTTLPAGPYGPQGDPLQVSSDRIAQQYANGDLNLDEARQNWLMAQGPSQNNADLASRYQTNVDQTVDQTARGPNDIYSAAPSDSLRYSLEQSRGGESQYGGLPGGLLAAATQPIGPLEDVANYLGRAGEMALGATNLSRGLGEADPAAQDVGQFVAKSVVPTSPLDLALTAIPAVAGARAGLAAGETLPRALGRGALEAFAFDPTDAGSGVPKLGTTAEELAQVRRQGIPGAVAAESEPARNAFRLAGGAPTPEESRFIRDRATGDWVSNPKFQEAASDISLRPTRPIGEEPPVLAPEVAADPAKVNEANRWYDYGTSPETQAYKDSLDPKTERPEYQSLWNIIQSVFNNSTDETERATTRALANEVGKTPYLVNRGELRASEGLMSDRLMVDAHLDGLSDETFGKIMRSPEYQDLRPEAKSIVDESLARQAASKAGAAPDPVAAVDNLVRSPAYQEARRTALETAGATVQGPSPEWMDLVTGFNGGKPLDPELADWAQRVVDGRPANQFPPLPVAFSEREADQAIKFAEQVNGRSLSISEKVNVVESELRNRMAQNDAPVERLLREGQLAKQEDWIKQPGGSTTGRNIGEGARNLPRSPSTASELRAQRIEMDARIRENKARMARGEDPIPAPGRLIQTQGGGSASYPNGKAKTMPAMAGASPASKGAARVIVDNVADAVNTVFFFKFGFDMGDKLRQTAEVFLSTPFSAAARSGARASIEASAAALTKNPEDAARFAKSLLDNSLAANTKGVDFSRNVSGATRRVDAAGNVVRGGQDISQREVLTSGLIRRLPGAERAENLFSLPTMATRIAMTDEVVKNMPQIRPDQAQHVANLFARATGRGSFGPDAVDKIAARAMGPVFTSARNMISYPERLSYLSPIQRLPGGKIEMFGPAWGEAVKLHAGFITSLGAIMGAATAIGFEVGWDPRNLGNFGSINVGDKKNPEWVDLTGGWRPYIATTVQEATGTKTYGNTLADVNRAQAGAEFFRNRLGIPGMAADLAQTFGADKKTGTQGIAEFLSPKYFDTGVFGTGNKAVEKFSEYAVPLWIQDVAQAVRHAPEGKGLERGLIAATSFGGVGVKASEASASGERAIDREPIVQAMIKDGSLPGVAPGTKYGDLRPEEQGKVNQKFAETNPEVAAKIAQDARAKGDPFQLARDTKEWVDSQKDKHINEATDKAAKGQLVGVKLRDTIQAEIGARNDVLNGVKDKSGKVIQEGLYQKPEYVKAQAELEKSTSNQRAPGNFFTDVAKQLRGEEPGTLKGQGSQEIKAWTDAYYKAADTYRNAQGKITDYDAVNGIQAALLKSAKEQDPALGARLEALVAHKDPNTQGEKLYYDTLNVVNQYYGLVPKNAPDSAQTWATYQLPWLIAHPQEEAMMYTLGYRNSVATQAAAQEVQKIFPGMPVTVKTYR